MQEYKKNQHISKIAGILSYTICSSCYILLLLGFGYLINQDNLFVGILGILLFLIPISLFIAIFTGQYRSPNWLPLSQFFWLFLPKELKKSLEKKMSDKYSTTYNFLLRWFEWREVQKKKQAERTQKEFLVNWEDIIFKDAEVLFIVRIFDTEFKLVRQGCIDIYNDYKSIVINLLPQIFVHIENGQFYIKNKEDFEIALLIIINRYKQDNQLVQTYESSNQTAIRKGIADRGTQYMQYLLGKQVKGLGVIRDREMVFHTTSTSIDYEPAYVFTLLSRYPNKYMVVYENMNTDDARASILCEIPIEKYSQLIPALVSYMGREKITNRRQKLHSTHKIREFNIDHAPHGDFNTWVNKIESKSVARRVYISITRPTRKKRWKRWRRYY